MNILQKLIVIFVINCFIINSIRISECAAAQQEEEDPIDDSSEEDASGEEDDGSIGVDPNMLNDKIYHKLFESRRDEHKILLDHFLEKDNYEAKYKLLTIGLNKILTVINDSKSLIETAKYVPTRAVPKDERFFEAISQILENTCLFGDLLLHLPDMSYEILDKSQQQKTWRDSMNWALEYIKPYYKNVIDKKTQKMLSLFDQEMNPERRTDHFINPYLKSNQEEQEDVVKKSTKKTEKPKKKKGPSLGGNNQSDKSEL